MSLVITRQCDAAESGGATCGGEVTESVVSIDGGKPRALDLCNVHRAEWLHPLVSLLDEFGRRLDGAPNGTTCPTCGREFESTQGLATHRSRVHGERSERSKTASSPKPIDPATGTRRKGVEPTHGRPFACPSCSLSYATRGALRQHALRVHSEPLSALEAQAGTK